VKAVVALAIAILLRYPDRLAAARRAAAAEGVPLAALLAVGVVEHALGGLDATDGARVWPHAGSPDEQATSAAHAIARWTRRCGSLAGGLQFYHRNDCRVVRCRARSHRHGREPYASLVLRLAGRLPLGDLP